VAVLVLLVLVLLVVVLLQAPLARVVVALVATVGGSPVPARVMLLTVAEELESLHELSFLCGDTSPERRTLVNRTQNLIRFSDETLSPR
jgi:predicted secreted protein